MSRWVNFISVIIFIIVFILFINCKNFVVSADRENKSILINEVLYNPKFDDRFYEWVELYNPSSRSINISGWIIGDNSANDSIEGDIVHGNGSLVIPAYGYAVITSKDTKVYENFSLPSNAIAIYVDDNSIGNGLGNNGDMLYLMDENKSIIDTVEWGIDYTEIPGSPVKLVDEGYSIGRYSDTGNSSIDFYKSIPTPASSNIPVDEVIKISSYPLFIAKASIGNQYSIPFIVNVSISNLRSYENSSLKIYITGENSSGYPASQTWNGEEWVYSNLYAINITADEYGSYSRWIPLRLNKEYQEYKKHVENNQSGFINVKLKREDGSILEVKHKIYFLDMDNSTSNGISGGFTVGLLSENISGILFIRNETDILTGCYPVEYNGIEEGFPSIEGYYKISSPIGEGYKIYLDDKLIYSNVSIRQGSYNLKLDISKTDFFIGIGESCDIPIILENTGDFNDTYHIDIKNTADNWVVYVNSFNINLSSHKSIILPIHIIPSDDLKYDNSSISVTINSVNDISIVSSIKFNVYIKAPDLTITRLKIYDENGKECIQFGEGEVIRIKAFLRNQGLEDASDVNIYFYYDMIDNNHIIGVKHYDSIGRYQKYPSIKWDTHNIVNGYHTIMVAVDESNRIMELNEDNNIYSTSVYIKDTSPSVDESKLLIAELYPYTHPNIDNEFITIYNPTDEDIDISRWYLTTSPLKNKLEENKIIFPNGVIIKPYASIIITENASAFTLETGRKPLFEYRVDSDKEIPQMFVFKTFILPNTHGVVALKDEYNHTIDLVVYGNEKVLYPGWSGNSIPVRSGVILKRQGFIDTNTSKDWVSSREYKIGQTSYPLTNLHCKGRIQTFVSPDCSYNVITSYLRNASYSIMLNMYMLTNPFLCDELVDALRRGVSVILLLDDSPVGGLSEEEKFLLNRIKTNGGVIRFLKGYRYNFNHAKYLIIDNETVIVESCNWVVSGVPKNPTYGNREWGIVIENKSLADSFLKVFYDDFQSDIYDIIEYDLPKDYSIDFYLSREEYSGYYNPCFDSKVCICEFNAIPVFSPDNSYDAICNLIDSAEDSIYIEQLYINLLWDYNSLNPFIRHLIDRVENGVDVKVIMNYNTNYNMSDSVETKEYLEKHGIEVKFIPSNWSYFSNIHNKGIIVDNTSVFIGSINWGENSVRLNREAGVIIENKTIARYYTNVFMYDWNLSEPSKDTSTVNSSQQDGNTIYILSIFTMTFVIIARDWRRRRWV